MTAGVAVLLALLLPILAQAPLFLEESPDDPMLLVAPDTSVEPGSLAPEFHLVDSTGTSRNPAEIRGRRALVLVFTHGAWCLECRRRLGEIQSSLASFRKLGAEVWAISPDPPGPSAALRKSLGLGFAILSDPDVETARRFGALELERRRIVRPTTFLLDRDGVVRWRRADEQRGERPSAGELLRVLEDMRPR